ncbi:hypothetical protein [Streptomyces sp. NBC_00316]|uniref:hypothetical protein n=1 Tax=Streptomyces sp. NBC_00316 TaxID=2975710 RepID=UPI002E2ADF1C|nr:hypothetical protein [Streptomyces sp. NBC_00316]
MTAAALLALTGCGAKADAAACKAAMAKAFGEAIAAGDTANSVKKSESPAACDGVDDETVQRFAAELISDRGGKAADWNQCRQACSRRAGEAASPGG